MVPALSVVGPAVLLLWWFWMQLPLPWLGPHSAGLYFL